MKNQATQKQYSEEQIIEKLEHFCAYQERCAFDVKKKMYQLQIDIKDYDKYLDYLKENNFLNEERFVERFANGKLNIKNWGKQKIINQLQQKQIDKTFIECEIDRIDDLAYQEKLLNILNKKNNLINETNVYKKRQKLIIYAQQKGFELDLILKTLENIL